MGKMLSPHFDEDEFKCPCCGAVDMKDEFIKKLEVLRYLIARPVVITSGYRCAKHNEEVGGKPSSAHLRGWAADIRTVDAHEGYLILDAGLKLFNRVGIAEGFVHLDNDPSLPVEVRWLY